MAGGRDVFTLEIRGLDEMNRRLEAIARANVEAAKEALRTEAEVEMTEAKERTPVRTGALRSSVRVEPSEDGLELKLKFGGTAAPYAVEVHENLGAFHHVGQAKFLESVLLESAPFLPERVARRMADENR